jgi:NAD(P)-dependent dehydrogenase (short-subunit alcohol dehydrogenase family)
LFPHPNNFRGINPTVLKHAVEGYFESLDHEVREHGVRVLLVEPSWIKTGLDANSVKPDSPLRVYSGQRQVAEQVLAKAVADGEDPSVVAKAVVAAVTDKKPKLPTPPARAPHASAPCVASSLPRRSTSRSARSTSSPADAVPRQSTSN